MVFLLFGPTYNSWAIGNQRWTYSQSLPAAYQQNFDNHTLYGGNLTWGATGPNGLFYLRTPTVQLYAPVPNLAADVTPQQTTAWTTREVEHLSFSSGGGWFISYNDQTARISMVGTFPEAFHTAAAAYLRTRSGSLQQSSQIQYVFFGARDTFIIQFRNGSLVWNDIPENIEQNIRQHLSQGLILAENSVLCPWDRRFYFLEWKRPFHKFSLFDTRAMYTWNIWPNGILTTILVREVIEGAIPVSHTAIQQDAPSFPPPSEYPIRNQVAPPVPERLSPQPQPPAGTGLPPVTATPSPRPQNSGSNNPFLKTYAKVDNFAPGVRMLATKLFNEYVPFAGADYITGTAAWEIFTRSNLSNEDLGKIWKISDEDANGKFTLDELTVAIDLIVMFPTKSSSNVSAPHSAPPVENISSARGNVSCDLCSESISDYKFHCSTCNNGNFDVCPICEEKGGRCPGRHPPEIIKISDKPNQVIVDSTTTRKTTSYVFCDLCTRKMPDYTYYCSICEGGSFDMCTSCNERGGYCPGRHNLKLIRIEVDDVLAEQFKLVSVDDNPKPNPVGSEGDDKTSRKGEDNQLKNSLLTSIIGKKENIKWDDIAGLEAAKEELQEAVILPIKFPQLFKGTRKARRGILLYGPPGTGKSYLAKAVATEAGATFFSVSSSDILSKWLGEAERLMKLLFELAREKKPSVIFIDEIDSLCGNRDGPNANSHLSGMKTELLVQMDGVGKDNEGVLLVGATNIPWSLDPAMRRRFQKKIHIPLPDEKARRQLFKIRADKMGAKLTKADFVNLGARSEGFSGSDINIVMEDADMVPVKKVHSTSHFRKVHVEWKEFFMPCNPTDAGAIAMTWKDVPSDKLKVPEALAEDIYSVLKKVKPSVAETEIQKCHEWTEEFGSEGA